MSEGVYEASAQQKSKNISTLFDGPCGRFCVLRPVGAVDAISWRTGTGRGVNANVNWSLTNVTENAVSTLANGNTLLTSKPRMNLMKHYKALINFSYGSENEPVLPAGAVKITIPLHAFYGRDGAPVDTFSTGLPKEPASDPATGSRVIIVLTANSNDGYRT